MPHNILLTGVSGYLGGTMLSRWKGWESAQKQPFSSSYAKLYVLVRTPEQADALSQVYRSGDGAAASAVIEPLQLDILGDPDSVREIIVRKNITIVYFLIDAMTSRAQVPMIEALGEVGRRTGMTTHFLHTTGAKLFSRHAGMPAESPILDTAVDLFEEQKRAAGRAPFGVMGSGVTTNNTVIETAEAHGVRSYIFAPCIVYGEGEGFGNKISIQTVAVIKAAKKLRQVYSVDSDNPTWPVCHVLDNTALYFQILRSILSGKDPGHGKNGYYLASPGSVAWNDIYSSIAKEMKKRGLVDDETVTSADDGILQKMGEALGCPKEFVGVQLGGKCTFTPEHGKKIGWKPQFPPEHILETAGDEVDLVLKYLKD